MLSQENTSILCVRNKRKFCSIEKIRRKNVALYQVLELEPGNTTVQEMYPLLQERLRLDKELPTESSSSEEEEEEEEGSSGSSSTHSSEGEDEAVGEKSPLNAHNCHH